MERPKRALVVEDKQVWQRRISKVLNREGFQVSIVGSYDAALDEMRRVEFDLITVDMRIYIDDQLEIMIDDLLGDIRDEFGNVPCIVVSGSDPSPEDTGRLFQEYGIVGFIEKVKFTRKKLSEMVAKAEEKKAEEKRRDAVSTQDAMTVLTSAVPILFEVLKWVRQDRLAREKEELSVLPDESSSLPADRTEITQPALQSAPVLLTVFQEMDLSTERESLERVRSLKRQMEKHRENINLYEEQLADLPVGRERVQFLKDLQGERRKLQEKAEEMKTILERLSGRQIRVAETD